MMNRLFGAAGTAVLAASLLWIPTAAGAQGVPADAEIAAAVERELLVSPGVPFNKIDVRVNGGTVTVSGTVQNILAKERATEVAGAVRGVRSVVNTMRVEPAAVRDGEIRSDVMAALISDPAADSYELNVSVANGVVTLAGTTQSWTEKRLAEQVAKGVKGVRDVKNEIRINWGSSRPDHQIAADVKSRLRWDARLDATRIGVEVSSGKVTLEGAVDSAAERQIALTDAWVAGVNDVNAEALKVEWNSREAAGGQRATGALTDSDIQQAVKNALLYDPRVLSFRPEVSVKSGVVTLTGVVDSLSAKRAAGDDARNTVGVWRVDNLLKVRPSKPPTDDELAKVVRGALLWDPWVDRYEISVAAREGTVSLNGTVDSLWERNRAEKLASGVNGVVDVRNNLNVARDILVTYTLIPADDWLIRQNIREQLVWSPYVDASEVRVAVANGVATLTGSVDTWAERSAAEENAREGGARIVLNNLKVDGGPDPLF